MGEPHEEAEGREEFGELLRYTLAGYIGGLVAGGTLDGFGLQRSALGQWLVRTLAGEGESLLEGVFALRRRLAGRAVSIAEAYGWGKLAGMTAPWVVDGVSRSLGVDVYGVEGFYLPYFYALSDQIGASLSGLLYYRRRADGWRATLNAYLRHPVMLASLSVILVVPFALLTARVAGFTPGTQLLTAVETIAANLCWVPPLVGWLAERRRARAGASEAP